MKQKEKSSLKQMVPALRFPEFANAGDWKERKLGDVLLGAPQYGLNAASVPFSDNLPAYLRITDISEEGFFLPEKKVSVDYTPKDGDYLIDGDIVLARTGASVGKSYKYRVNDGKLVFAGYLIRIKPDSGIVNSSFIYNYFFTQYYWKWVSVVSSRSGQPGINGSEYASFPITLPSLPEQQKIADCLSSLDEVISLESQKLKSLQSYKKGLLQNLFPAEGESVPKLRFPEFVGKGDWEENQFSKYIRLYRGSSPRPIQEYLTKSNSGVNWIKIGDTKLADNYTIKQVEEKITLKGAEKSRKVNRGELILANSMSFGKTYELAIDGFIYDGWFVLREYEDYLYKPFLLQLLNSEYMQNQYAKLSAGGIVQNISSEIVYSTTLPTPSLPEQKKIAECLSSVDVLIQEQSERVEGLKAHKKGLLQGLFPVMGEF